MNRIEETVSRETVERLNSYVALLRSWNQRQQLVSARDMPDLWERHMADSLAVIPLLAAGRLADFGAGAGFPGLVVSIATGARVHLIEANKRKAAFLQEAIRITQANASVLPIRIEAVTECFDTIMARALAPLTALLALARPRLAQGGRCLLFKGREHASEIQEARRVWTFRAVCHPVGSTPDAVILEVSDVKQAR